ncbi:MAG: tetratricopeptide repeat protein [Ignavibacteriae bacterium]|nr:tetratricopeptide repeat protein [Ignavibacteriota bacterium]
MKSIFKIVTIIVLIIGIVAVSLYINTKKERTAHYPSLTLHSFGSEAEFKNAQKAIEHYRKQLEQYPEVTTNYVEFAQLLFQVMKSTGERKEFLPTIQWLLDEALEWEPQNYVALTTKAELAANLHQFSEAKLLAEKSLLCNSYYPATYAVLIDANIELGNYQAAIQISDKLQSLRPGMSSYSRVAYLRELHGDIDGAIQAMQLAADAGVAGDENRAWALYQLGMLFVHDGKLDTAEYLFKGILQERAGYANAHAGLGRVFKQRQNYEEAIIQFKNAIGQLREPAFYEELGEVYERAGLQNNAIQCFDVAEELYEQETEVGEDNAVELAMFLASHDRNVLKSLELARGAVQRRPGIHGYHAFALALFKNGKYSEAQHAIEQAMRLGTRDASLLELANVIARKNGRV